MDNTADYGVVLLVTTVSQAKAEAIASALA